MGVGADTILSSLKIPPTEDTARSTQYVAFLCHRFESLFTKKHGSDFGKDNEDQQLKNLEILVRYLQLNFIRALRLDPANNGPQIGELKPISDHIESLAIGSLYPKEWRFVPREARKHASKQLDGSIPIASAHIPLRDLTITRLWFAHNSPVPEETTWELYKRFDPNGTRKMHQGQFFSLLPKDWRDLGQYKHNNSTYEECLQAERKDKRNS